MTKHYFYKNTQKTRDIEKYTKSNIDQFIEIIKNDKKLKKYVQTFGILGPCARGEGFYYNNEIRGDIDFCIITTRIDPLREWYLQKRFRDTFADCGLYSLIIFSPTIFKKPDLMFYEFAESGKVLYGRLVDKISIYEISRFEAFRNIIYRFCFFLSLFNIAENRFRMRDIKEELFLYYYSKIIFAIGEVMLLLTKEYIANNRKRNESIKNNKLAKNIQGFTEEHQHMQDFRESLIIPADFSFKNYTKKAFDYILQCYGILFRELFDCDTPLKCGQFVKIRAKGLSFLSTHFFFTWNYFWKFKKIRLHLIREPIIVLSLNMYKFIKKIDSIEEVKETELKNILKYWKAIGWFYYPI